jgi:hypothetical protein
MGGVADAPSAPAAAFHPGIVLTPLLIVGGGAVATYFAAQAAARGSTGGWIDLSSLSYAIAWLLYGLGAAGFLWMDRAFVRKLPGRTWSSARRMLTATLGAVVVGAVAGLAAGLMLGGALIFLATQHMPGADGLVILFVGAIPLAGVVGLVLDLRMRSSARIRQA